MGGVERSFALKRCEVPCGLVLLNLVMAGIEDDVGFGAIADPSSFWVLTGDVHCVNDRVDEGGVADDGLVIHDTDIDESAIRMDVVEWVLWVMFKGLLASDARWELEPTLAASDSVCPFFTSVLEGLRVGGWGGPLESAVGLCLVD